MKRLENVFLMVVILSLLLSMYIYTYRLDDIALIVYLIIGTVCGIFVKPNKYIIVTAFTSCVIFSIFAQLYDLEWFYHDMPERITIFYLLISFIRAVIFVAPIFCGTGISWLIECYMNRSK